MLVKYLRDCTEITASDGTTLRELLHSKNDGIDLGYSIAHATLRPGGVSRRHTLKTSSELYYVIGGRGIVHVGRESKEVRSGCAVYIPAGTVQFVENIGCDTLEFLCIVSPPWRAEDEEVIK